MRNGNTLTNVLLIILLFVILAIAGYAFVTRPEPTQRLDTSSLFVSLNPTETPRPTRTPRVEPNDDDGVPARVTVVIVVTATPEATPVVAQVATAAPTATPEVEMTPSPTATIMATGETWRVRQRQDGSYGPQLGYSEPGYGTSDNEIATAVGVKLTFHTREGLITLDGGCQQVVVPPNNYAKNAGGEDWGFVTWEFNPEVTEYLNEMAVLTWELALQQISAEGCPDLPNEELLDHVWVVEEDESVDYVKLTPWREWRRASGENHTIMFAPGDSVYGWHMGYGSSQDDLCDGGECYLPVAENFGWCGGCVVNTTWPGEIPENAVAIEN